MYTIYAEKYHNDYTRKPLTMKFATLDEIFEYMKKISHNFNNKYGNYFPTRDNEPCEGYDWCSRIECNNEDDSLYYLFWIYQIDSENGTVYSNGKYTKGEKFCSHKVEEWLKECSIIAKNIKPNFVED